VNWTPKLPREMLLDGCLPDVRLPLLVDDAKYCQISFTDSKSNVEFGFYAKYVCVCLHRQPAIVLSLWLYCCTASAVVVEESYVQGPLCLFLCFFVS